MQYQHHLSSPTDGFGCTTSVTNSNNSPTCNLNDPAWSTLLPSSKTTTTNIGFSSDITFFPATTTDATVAMDKIEDVFSSKGYGLISKSASPDISTSDEDGVSKADGEEQRRQHRHARNSMDRQRPPSSGTIKQKRPTRSLSTGSQTNNPKLSIQRSPDASNVHQRRRHYPRSNSFDSKMPMPTSPETPKKSSDPITPRKSSEQQRRQRPSSSRKHTKSRSRSFTSVSTSSAGAAPTEDTVSKLPPTTPSTPRTRRRKSNSFTSPPKGSFSIPPRPTPSPSTTTHHSRSSLQTIVKTKSNKTKMEREFLEFLREKKEYKGTKKQIQDEFFQHLKDKQICQEQQRSQKVQMESELLQFLRHKEQQSYTKQQLEKEFLQCLQQKQAKTQQQHAVVQSPASRHRVVLGAHRSMSVRSLSPSPKARGLLHGDNDIARNALVGKRQTSLRSMVTVKSNKVKVEQELNDLFHVVQHQCPMKEKADIMKEQRQNKQQLLQQQPPPLLNEKENKVNGDTSGTTKGRVVGGQELGNIRGSSLPPKSPGSPSLSKFFHKKISAANIKQHAQSLPKASEHDMSTDTWRGGGWTSGEDESTCKIDNLTSRNHDLSTGTADANVKATTATAEELLNMILYGKSSQESSNTANEGADVSTDDHHSRQNHDKNGGRKKLDKSERRRRRLQASRQRRQKKRQGSKDSDNSSKQDTSIQWVREGGDVIENIPEEATGLEGGDVSTDDEANSIDSFTTQDLVRMDSKATATTTATTGTLSTFDTASTSNAKPPLRCNKESSLGNVVQQHHPDKVTHIRSLAYNSSHHNNKGECTMETDGEDNIDGFAYDSTS